MSLPVPFLLLLPLLLLPSPASTLEFRYHSNQEVALYLQQVNASNSDVTHLYSIGRSVLGQQLWVLALGRHPRSHATGIPEFKYVANMHGNEVLGRVLLLHLIEELLRGYRDNQTWAVRLLDSTRIHILPSMNPDGFDAADTDCQYSQGRYNHNGVDLNRNFPDAFIEHQGRGERREAEVQAVMDWLQTESFVLSANLHGGALVASYPYDNSNGGSEQVGDVSLSPDNDVFVHLAKKYSYSHGSMHRGHNCHDTRPFPDGITNGYQWYPLAGGMQDYNYVWAQCLEVTLELSCCKFPPVQQLPVLWEENRQALLAFIQQVHLGVKGRVLDSSGVPAHNALVEVKGRSNLCPFRTDRHGEYYRLLLPGRHTFTVSLANHQPLTETLDVPYGPDSYSALRHDFLLQRAANAPTLATPSWSRPSTTCNHTLLLEGGVAQPAGAGLCMILGLVLALHSLID